MNSEKTNGFPKQSVLTKTDAPQRAVTLRALIQRVSRDGAVPEGARKHVGGRGQSPDWGREALRPQGQDRPPQIPAATPLRSNDCSKRAFRREERHQSVTTTTDSASICVSSPVSPLGTSLHARKVKTGSRPLTIRTYMLRRLLWCWALAGATMTAQCTWRGGCAPKGAAHKPGQRQRAAVFGNEDGICAFLLPLF